MKNYQYIKSLATLAGMVIFPLTLLFLPANFFDQGPTLCLFTLATGVNCPGCGMTRACMRLIHFDFEGAWLFNKASFVVFPIILIIYTRFFVEKFRRIVKI